MSVRAKFQLPSMSRSGRKVCVWGWGGGSFYLTIRIFKSIKSKNFSTKLKKMLEEFCNMSSVMMVGEGETAQCRQ